MFKYLRAIIFWPFLILFIIIIGTIIRLLALLFKNKERVYQRSIHFFASLLLLISGVRVKVTGKENFSEVGSDQGLFIAANHFSFIDTYVLLAKLPFLVRFTVHQAGFKMPFLKTVYQGAGYIGVGPKGVDGLAGLAQLFKATKQKEKIVIYSDVSYDENKFQFNPKLIELSQHLQIPILPIYIKGAARVLPLGKFPLGSGKISLSIGKPAYFSSVEELKQEILRLA